MELIHTIRAHSQLAQIFPAFTRKFINVFTSAAWLHSTTSYTYFLETAFQYYLPILSVCGLPCLLAPVLSLEFCMHFLSSTNHGICDITNTAVGFCWKLRSVSCENFIAILTPTVMFLFYLMPATAWLIQTYHHNHHHHHHHHHHVSVMELGHLLTRTGLTHPEVFSKVCHDSFCQLGSSVSLPG